MEAMMDADVLNEVKNIVESTLKMPFGKLDVDAAFDTFGLDSIIAMELLTNLSKKFKISITPAQFIDVNNVRELSDFIKKSIAPVKHTLVENEVAKPVAKSVQTPKSVPKQDNRPKQNLSNTRALQQRNRKTATRSSQENLLNYIETTYSIDIRHHAFESVDDIVDELVSNHLEELLQHYDLLKDFSDRDSDDTESFSEFSDTHETHNKLEDIAIVGMACNFPDAATVGDFWNNLINENSSIREIPKSRWDWESYYSDTTNPDKTISKWGALLENVNCFDYDFFKVSEQEAKFMDPQERLLLAEAYKALQDAGINPEKISGTDVGVFIGYEYAEYEQYIRSNRDNIKNCPMFTSSSPTYYLANRLSYLFNFCGPSESINTNCASSAVAINRAYQSLLTGESSLAIAGGVCLNLFAEDYIAASQHGMLSANGTCGVFDDDANGFTRGEGVGVVVLKRLKDAKRDNDKIYAVVKSCHQNNRGNANFISEIKHEAITSVISDCYKKANIEQDTVSYIEVDGYATKWGDSFEFEGIKNVFKSSSGTAKTCALGSVKGNIGHLEPASGIASFIKVALSLKNKKFPSTITKKNVSKFIDINNSAHPLYIADEALTFDKLVRDENIPVRAGVNSFADSGANVHILLEEYVSNAPINNADASARQLFIISARNRNRLNDCVNDFIDFLADDNNPISFADMVYTSQIGRQPMEERLAIIAHSKAELLAKLNVVKSSIFQEKLTLDDKGIFYGNLDDNKNNPFVSLITKGMTDQLLEQSLQEKQWQQIALLWTNGVNIPWEKVWNSRSAQRVTLPYYPFAKESCWVELNNNEPPPSKKIIARNEIASHVEPKDKIAKAPSSVASAKSVLWEFSRGENVDSESLLLPAKKIELFLKQEVAFKLNQSIENISVDKNFLELGFDSIGIADIIYKTIDLLQQNISPSVLFSYPDIQSFSQYLAETYPDKISHLLAKQKKNDSIQPSGSYASEGGVPQLVAIDRLEHGQYPLGFAQERLFFLEQMEPGSAAHIVPFAVVIQGDLDLPKLERAFNNIISRHESLRTVFLNADGQMVQKILASLEFTLGHTDLSECISESIANNMAKEICQTEAASPFDLAHGPLVRCKVIKLGMQQHLLMITMHHIISDGWSVGILIKELGLIVNHVDEGKKISFAPLAIQFLDYCVWQKKCLASDEWMQPRLKYWGEKLSGIPDSLDIATDFPRPKTQNYSSASYRFYIEKELTERVSNLSMDNASTVNMVLLAAFKVLFCRYSGQSDILIGSVSANRDFNTAGLIGCFFNVLPIRTNVKGDAPFIQILNDIKKNLIEANNYQLPIERIKEQLNADQKSNAKLINVLFNQLPPDASQPMPFGSGEVIPYDYAQTESLNLSDLSIFIGIQADGITIELVYSTELYRDQTVQKIALDYTSLLNSLAQNSLHSIDKVFDDCSIPKSKSIKFISNYTLDPILQLADTVTKALPGKPKVTIAGYNQVMQELAGIGKSIDDTYVVCIMLEDSYHYKKNASLADKKNLVQDYCDMLLKALSQSTADSIFIVIHKVLLDKVNDKQEQLMLINSRKSLLKKIEKITSVTLIDEDFIESKYPINSEKYLAISNLEGHVPFTDSYYIALTMGIMRAYYQHQETTIKKVVVLDGDNTLWRGIAGEDGLDGIEVSSCFKHFQQQLRQKKEEGYILALCSKNEVQDVTAIFSANPEMILKSDDFAIQKINWQKKSKNLIDIARELGVGLNSLVFVDDSQLEIEEMRSQCPEVLSILMPKADDQVSNFIADLWCFDKKRVTQEDRKRTEMVSENLQRQKLAEVLDYSDFIQQLNIEIRMSEISAEEVDRVSQLTQRTNQFNANKKSYSEAEISHYLQESNHRIKTIYVTDKFGDYGLVGAIFYKQFETHLVVDQFLLSCRALGRQVEEFMIKRLFSDEKIDSIKIEFVKTERNQPVQDFLEMIQHSRQENSFEMNRSNVLALNLSNTSMNRRSEQPGIVEESEVIKTSNSAINALYIDTRIEEAFLSEMAKDYRSVTSIKEKMINITPQKITNELTQYLAPRNEAEMQLTAIWADILKLKYESIGVNDSFFFLGGHSLSALKLVAEIESTFKKSLPLSSLFTASTIAAMAALIQGEVNISPDILISMQPLGNNEPVFGVPGATGSVLSLQQLSHALGNEQPFYGLQTVGFDGKSAPLQNITELANANISAIKSIQPLGPYRLIGYSNGGVVAYEMARILLENGEEISSLVFIDSLCPLQRVNDVIDEIVDVCKNLIETLGSKLHLDADELRRLSPEERADFLYNIMAASGFEITREQFFSFYRVATQSEIYCRNYKPEKLSHKVSVSLYRATEAYPDMSHDYGWNELLLEDIRVVNVKSDHLTIMYDEPIRQVASDIISSKKSN